MDVYIDNIKIHHLVSEVMSIVQPLAAKNGNNLALYMDKDIGEMDTDITLVRQSLLNLVSNACKFTHNGNISLEIKHITNPFQNIADPNQRDWVSMQVTDTGIGIPDVALPKLFKDFSQADNSTTRQYGGTGLGLAISHRYCKMLGGDILVQSHAGHGSIFTMVLPTRPDDSLAQRLAI